MEFKKTLVSLVVILALVFAIANVSALGSITSIEVNSVELVNGGTVSVFAGETLPVRVVFAGDVDSSDARLKLWISGARDYSVSSDRFKVLNGGIYSKLFAVQVPFDVDPSEDLTLNVLVESQNGGSPVLQTVSLSAQRESYIVEVLDVNMESKVQAGNNLALDVVLKNRGIEFSEDTFVEVKIPALGVSQRAYFGDMSPVDQENPDKEDAAERRMVIAIPADAKAGVYAVEVVAFNGDSSTVVTKKLAVVGASESSMVVSSSRSKTFAVGEKATYTLTLVNSGSKIKVYQLIAESSDENLNIDVDESVIAIPAGSSKTVKVMAAADKAGKYDFTVNVLSNGDIVKSEALTANVEGTAKGFSGNAAVVLTVVLAIIFIVLLIVLIVLLTRKPEKQEMSESYY